MRFSISETLKAPDLPNCRLSFQPRISGIMAKAELLTDPPYHSISGNSPVQNPSA